MSQSKCLSLVAGAGVSFFAASVNADTQSYTQTNPDEVRAIVSEMLADADTRSSLLASGGMGGHDTNGFFLSDGANFRLSVGGQIQFRYYLNWRDTQSGGPNRNAATDGGTRTNDDFESGFQTTNTRIWFDGNVVDPNLFYHIVGNFNRGVDGGAGGFDLEEAYVGYKWDNGLMAQWGQFKLPFLREELIAGWYQLAADRSFTNETFNQDYSQGIEVGYSAEDWRIMGAFSDGFRSRNTEVGSVNNALGNFGFADNGGGEADWAITGRFEYKFAGNWDQFKQFTGMPGTDFGCLFGVAGHVEQSANRIATTIDTNNDGVPDTATEGRGTFGGWTADLSFQGDGWNAFIAGVGMYTDTQTTAGDTNFGDYGVVVQGGVFIPGTEWEVFGRYDVTFADGDRRGITGATGNDAFNTITAGVNYYWSGQAAKFTFDVQYFIDNASDGLNTTQNREIGYFGSGQDGEVTLRFQFQLLF